VRIELVSRIPHVAKLRRFLRTSLRYPPETFAGPPLFFLHPAVCVQGPSATANPILFLFPTPPPPPTPPQKPPPTPPPPPPPDEDVTSDEWLFPTRFPSPFPTGLIRIFAKRSTVPDFRRRFSFGFSFRNSPPLPGTRRFGCVPGFSAASGKEHQLLDLIDVISFFS